MKYRTDRFRYSFFPNAISTWNELICHFERLPSREKLKQYLLCFFRPCRKSVFGLHDPDGPRNLFQLRLGLSVLRSHKKQHNFLDTTSDVCLCRQGIENTNHFFNRCPLHNFHREKLVNDVGTILRNNNLIWPVNTSYLYLYGHPSLGDSDNKEILKCSIRYIKAKNRFLTT